MTSYLETTEETIAKRFELSQVSYEQPKLHMAT